MAEAAPQVLSVGFGKAGHTLHGPNWLNAGFEIIAYDAHADKLSVANLPEHMQAEHEAGRLTLISSLDQVSLENLALIDVVTASGCHAEGVSRALDAIEAQGGSGSDYTWLLEKPLVSSVEEETALLRHFDAGRLVDDKVFVNENYNASTGVTLAKEMIGDTPVDCVDVVFYKDRVPDVRKGRFTDPNFGAYGIEMPHMVAVAQNLAGLNGQPTKLTHNEYLHNVSGVPDSTGNYTVVSGQKNGRDVTLRMAQGLGPFEIDGNGQRVDRELGKTMVRYSDVYLGDGRQVKVEFDPVAGLERYTTRVTEFDHSGEPLRSEVVKDNTLAMVINGVAHFQRTGEQPVFADAIRVATALSHVHAISEYVTDARRQGTFPTAS